jgi:heme O synthase-like polyprenyltransferase
MFFNLIFLLYLTNINSFIKIKSYDLSFKKSNSISIYCNNKLKEKIIDKSKNYLKLIRSKNILPTLLLSFTGGWITNPSIYNLLRSKTFITSTIITQFIMSSSMIMNDIYD